MFVLCAFSFRDVSKSGVSDSEDAEIIVIRPEIDWDDEEDVVSGLTLIGIVGIEDPVRPEVILTC